jgi:hypothetical protein
MSKRTSAPLPRWRICAFTTELRVGGAQNVLDGVVTASPQDRYQTATSLVVGERRLSESRRPRAKESAYRGDLCRELC